MLAALAAGRVVAGGAETVCHMPLPACTCRCRSPHLEMQGLVCHRSLQAKLTGDLLQPRLELGLQDGRVKGVRTCRAGTMCSALARASAPAARPPAPPCG